MEKTLSEGSVDDQGVDRNRGDQGKGDIGFSVYTQDTIEGVSDLKSIAVLLRGKNIAKMVIKCH